MRLTTYSCQVATFRGSDADPKERFVHHNAGLDGFGGSSYIDSVILTDRDQRTGTGGTSDLPWGSAADGTCETRTYLLQNWRADTSVLMKATSGGGVVLQRIKYSPYGTPERLFGIQDFNKDGFVEFTDFDDFVAAFDNGEPSSDVNQDGFLDFSDFDAFQGAFEDTSITDGGREIRKLWAGYEAEVGNGVGLHHVRNRVFLSSLGSWIQRDPLEYVFPSVSLTEYVHSQAIMLMDPTGLQPHISPDGDLRPSTIEPDSSPSTAACSNQSYPSGLAPRAPGVLAYSGCKNLVPKLGYKPSSNGCGTSGISKWLPSVSGFGDVFRAACDNHDYCYGTWGTTKSACDTDFAKSMAKTCKSRKHNVSLFDYNRCMVAVAMFYSAVFGFGGDAYQAGQKGAVDCCDYPSMYQTANPSSCGVRSVPWIPPLPNLPGFPQMPARPAFPASY